MQVRYIELICSPSSQSLLINPDAFRSSQNYAKILEIKGCDLSNLDYSFLANFTSMSSLKIYSSYNLGHFQGFPSWLPSLNELWITRSSDFSDFAHFPGLINLTSLFIHNCDNFRFFDELQILPGLKFLDIASCPKFRQWDIFHTQMTRLKEIHLRSCELDDNDVAQLLDEVASSPVSETLAYLNLRDNAITRIPEQIGNFVKLSDVNLDYNQIHILEKESLQMKSARLKTLSLLNNDLHTIESGAFQGNIYLFFTFQRFCHSFIY